MSFAVHGADGGTVQRNRHRVIFEFSFPARDSQVVQLLEVFLWFVVVRPVAGLQEFLSCSGPHCLCPPQNL